MLLRKGLKLLPVRDLLLRTPFRSRLCLDISGCHLALTPQVDGVATDVEHLTHFAFLVAIQFNGLHHFLAEVITICFTHDSVPKR